jgi:sugar phosphate isomerase/epimerase
MKLCCSSRSYARSLHSGALTQLEWIDRCAELEVDGVEFEASHFPRHDADYLAQVKKLCVDRGLTVASLALDVAFGDDVDRQVASVAQWIDRAASVGAPLIRFACGSGTGSGGIAWRELVRALKAITAIAKDRNVTLALEARDATLVATAADVKRVIKECDSAWLRPALTTAQLAGERADEWIQDVPSAVIVVCGGDASDANGIARLRDGRYIGFVSLDRPGADDDATEVPRAVAALRALL